jgi:hypothetical protein
MHRFLPLTVFLACSGPETTETGTSVDACEVSGNICTWLGVAGFAGQDADGSFRADTLLYLPVDIDFTADGTAYYPDYNNHRIRRVSPDGIVDTLSGTGFLGDGPNTQGSVVNCWSPTGCDSLTFAWNHPTQVVPNPTNPNELWVAAWHNSRLNKLDLETGTTYWYVGSGARFYGDAPAGDVNANGTIFDEVVMDLPSSIAFDDAGLLYFSDQANHLIRRVDLENGTIENIVGEPRIAGYDGDGGPASEAHLHSYTDQKADPGSKLLIHDNFLYYADTLNGVIRRINLETMVIELYAGKYESLGLTTYTDAITGLSYEADAGSVAGYSGDGGPATEAVLNTPRDIAMGIDGELYIAEPKNQCVRVVYADGTIDTFAGTCVSGGTGAYSGDEGPASAAQLNEPFGVAVDAEGNVYISDTLNQVIRRVKH